MKAVLAKLQGVFRRHADSHSLFYRAFVEQAANGVVLADATSLRILDANPALLTRAGFSRDDIGKIDLNHLFEPTRRCPDSLRVQIGNVGGGATYCWFEKQSGGPLAEIEVNCTLFEDNGRPLVALMTNDVSLRNKIESQLLENQQRLDHLAHHDQLTDLPNRHYLTAFLPGAIQDSKQRQKMLAILFIDLDHFKHVNDSRGHEVGDRLLQEVARRIKSTTRESDVVIRMGGDEFVVVLRGIHDLEQISQAARRVNRELDQPITIDGHKLVTTASIGVSLYPRDGSDISELLKHSDSAMYQAKEGGRNKFQMFRAEMTEKIKKRVALEAALRAAIKLNQFDVAYQPIIDLCSNRVAGLEALVRWLHPEDGIVSPEVFIDVAEESGLIVPIGNFVLRHVLQDMRTWKVSGLSLVPVSVNISPAQLQQGDLSNVLKKLLSVSGFGPEVLELELTERAMFVAGNARGKPSSDTIAELREAGFRIAIDDFGTGYSSLSYLKRWRVDKLKIDRSFIRDLVTDQNDFAIVSAILAIARQMRIDVVAEGIEGYPQVQKLVPLGCRYGQGYLFARPQLAEDCAQFLQCSVKKNPDEPDLLAEMFADQPEGVQHGAKIRTGSAA